MLDKQCPIPEPFGKTLGNIFFITGLFFLTFTSRFVIAPLLPTIEQELAITHSQAGRLFLMQSVGFFAAAVLSGFLSSRINHRGSLILSSLAAAAALLSIYPITSFRAMSAAMVLLGIAGGLHIPSAVATITAMVNREDWGKALAIHQSAPPLGLVTGPLITVAMMEWISWRTLLALLASLTILATLGFVRYCPCGDFPGDAPRLSPMKGVMGVKSFWMMVILFALAMGGGVGIYSMLPLYLVTERGFDRELGNTLLGLSQVSGLFMAFFSGWVTDRIGERRAMAFTLVAAGLATILLGTLSGGWLKVVLFLQPAFFFSFFPAGFSALSRIVQPNLRSIAASLGIPMAFVLGGGILPAVVGYMGQTASFSIGITLAGFLIITGSVLILFVTLLERMDEGC